MTFEAFTGLGRRAPWLAVPMVICLMSLLGIPPFAGFVAKWWLLIALGKLGGTAGWLGYLGWVLVVAMLHLPYSLVPIEPFDAYIVRVAGWATITVAVVGLLASLFVPMAYCRFGCPTGAMLSFLRFHARSDRWGARDAVALAFVVGALIVWLAG